MSLSSFFVIFLFGYFLCVASQGISEISVEPPIFPSAENEDPFEPFVVGGKPADRYEFPWLVNLKVNKTDSRVLCGGSLIDWVRFL